MQSHTRGAEAARRGRLAAQGEEAEQVEEGRARPSGSGPRGNQRAAAATEKIPAAPRWSGRHTRAGPAQPPTSGRDRPPSSPREWLGSPDLRARKAGSPAPMTTSPTPRLAAVRGRSERDRPGGSDGGGQTAGTPGLRQRSETALGAHRDPLHPRERKIWDGPLASGSQVTRVGERETPLHATSLGVCPRSGFLLPSAGSSTLLTRRWSCRRPACRRARPGKYNGARRFPPTRQVGR